MLCRLRRWCCRHDGFSRTKQQDSHNGLFSFVQAPPSLVRRAVARSECNFDRSQPTQWQNGDNFVRACRARRCGGYDNTGAIKTNHFTTPHHDPGEAKKKWGRHRSWCISSPIRLRSVKTRTPRNVVLPHLTLGLIVCPAEQAQYISLTCFVGS
jgi:hypothetical protein